MKVLLHFESLTAPAPAGAWWQGSNETLNSFYVDKRMEKEGKSQMYSIHPSTDIDRYFDYLDKRMPYGQTWVLEDLPEGETPQQYVKDRSREAVL